MMILVGLFRELFVEREFKPGSVYPEALYIVKVSIRLVKNMCYDIR